MLKVNAGGSLGTKSSVYSLWTNPGSLNDDATNAASLSTSTTFKSSVVDQWENSFIRAVRDCRFDIIILVKSVIIYSGRVINMIFLKIQPVRGIIYIFCLRNMTYL